MYSDTAIAPFGETYAQAGVTDVSYTGQNQDTIAGDYDFPDREYESVSGRWPSPDPAGLAAVDPSDPLTWNRYAYVRNSPLEDIDPLGLDCWGLQETYMIGNQIVWQGIIASWCDGGGPGPGNSSGGKSSDGTVGPPGLHVTEKAYEDCAKQAFGGTSGIIPGSNGRSIPGYEAGLDVYQVSFLMGIDPSVVAGTLAEESNSNLAMRNSKKNPNGTVDVGPMQLNSANNTNPAFQSYVHGNPYGTDLSPQGQFNGDAYDNILTGAAYLRSFGPNNYDQYVSPSGDATRQTQLDQMNPYFTALFDCMSAHSF